MRRLIVLGLVALALLAPTFAHPAAAQMGGPAVQTTHVVQLGETLYSIAMRYGVSASAIATANRLVNPDFIYAGQTLVIPGSGMPGPRVPQPGNCRHVVQLGDTLTSIAWQYGTSVAALMSANGITNANFIYAGQSLVIPGCGGPVQPAPGPSCGQTHIVKPGETLSGIAARCGLAWLTIARANGIGYPYMIYAGQGLYIPCQGEGAHHPPAGKPHGKPAPRPQPTKAPALARASCPREIQIVDPLEKEKVGGVLQIIGTASIANFQFYKLEYAMGHDPLDGAFHSINEVYRSKVWDGILGTWYTGNMPDGAYTLRLTVVDVQGQYPRPCNVHVYLDN